jgi:YVTN family beta-propeller protein
VGSGPAGIAVTPNGKRAYVTDAGNSPIGSTVTPINLVTHKALAPITVGEGPQGIAITPDGKLAYVANAGAIVTGQVGSIGSTVTPIDLSTDRALAPITVGNAPLAVAISADGSTVFVANSYSGSVSPIAVSTNGAGTPIEMQGSPQAIAVAPSQVYVTNASSSTSTGDNVTAISVAAETAGGAIAVPKNPTGIAVSANGKTAWVVSFATDSLVEIDLSTNKVVATDKVGLAAGPYAIALAEVPSSAIAKLFPSPTKKS